MRLGLTVTLVMLIVMGVIGGLGYLMDMQVDRSDKDGRPL